MNANNIIDEVKAAAAATSEVSHFPVNVVEAHTLRGNIPKFDVTPLICIGIKSFVYGELLTSTAASGETVTPGTRQHTGCVSIGFFFKKTSQPKDMYNLFNILCSKLLSADNQNRIVKIEHGGVEYDRTYDALVLRGSVTETTTE